MIIYLINIKIFTIYSDINKEGSTVNYIIGLDEEGI